MSKSENLPHEILEAKNRRFDTLELYGSFLVATEYKMLIDWLIIYMDLEA